MPHTPNHDTNPHSFYTADNAAYNADSRTSQLRRSPYVEVGSIQKGILLPSSPLVPSNDADDADAPSIRLQRWFRELASRLVCGQKGMVLRSLWQGLPHCDRLCYDKAT